MTPRASVDFELKYDLRNPLAWRKPWPDLYQQLLDQVAWADEHGFTRVHFHEHHFADDGYLPAPGTVAAAVAARTKRIRISLNLIVLPLKHPVQVAEEAAILDIISGGRMEFVFGAGYRRAEFEAYGIPIQQRPSRMDEAIEIIRRCWEEDEFDFNGRYWTLKRVRVEPKPIQKPRPRIVLGGSTPPGALRAARLGDGFTTATETLLDTWRQEMLRLGKDPEGKGTVTGNSPGLPKNFLHISYDPAAAWKVIGPHALHESNSYSEWARDRGTSHYSAANNPDDLLAAGYGVLTPGECVAAGREIERRPGPNRFVLHPMMGGMPYALGQESLELAVSEVMPQLNRRPN